MATYNFKNLPQKMHNRVIAAFNNDDYDYLKKVYLAHNVISCGVCLNHRAIREWTTWAIKTETIKSTTDGNSGD